MESSHSELSIFEFIIYIIKATKNKNKQDRIKQTFSANSSLH